MKFSITFKYSNVTFKNKENKETVTFDSKAEGNTFTFDNVDEDVVLGIVKGIKDRKASQVFAYDNLRTNFVNVIARNKCKELYDKLDKGGWKVEDVAISNVTIKDLEFTKPTMNARETLTVESRRKVGESIYDNNLDEALNLLNEAAASLHMAMWDIKKELGKDSELFKRVERNYNDVHETYGIMEGFMDKEEINESFKDTIHKQNQADLSGLIEVVTKACKEIDIISNMYDVSDTSFEKLQDVRTMLLNALPSTKTAKKMGWCNESKYGNGPWPTWVVKERLVQLIKGVSKEHPMWADLVDILEKYYGSMDVEKLVSESKEQVKVEFKKTPEDGEVIAFFPDTAKDGSCNPGMIMSYMHVGQHGEASVEFYNDCTTCMEEDYADLLAELEKVYDDCELVVVE